ncbi:hypothetical protein [Christiangramia lutea]|nr:hypothetical protein [Christiangramia lutea]
MVLNTFFNDIDLFNNIYLNFSPQLYHLIQDDLNGIYSVSFIVLGKRDFPFSLTSILNEAIKTEILPEDDFV